MVDLPEYVEVNRAHWNVKAEGYVAPAERNWALEVPQWGEWNIPDAELALLPPDMSGMRAIELGCGTAYVSSWMARRGATVTGIDVSEAQLATAARLAGQYGIELELIHGNAERVDRPDASFDFAISEYGAAIWCDPYVWIPEAHRLLVPGGELVFLGNHILCSICSPVDGSLPVTRRLEQPYFGQYRHDWRDATDEPGGIEFNLTMSAWIRLFNRTGFEILDFAELQAPADTKGASPTVSTDWAREFPSEHVWRLRRG